MVAAEQTITQAGEVRSARLESLRAIAALGVVAGHIFGQAHAYNPEVDLGSYWHRILLGGGFGVFLFFGLTGYLLYLPFARRAYTEVRELDLRRYAVNRVLRIVPLYLVAVVVLLIVQEHGGTLGQWWRFLTFSENFSLHTVGTVDGPLWSLVVEVQFYVLLPLLSWALTRVGRGRKLGAAAALVLLAALSYAARHHAVGTDRVRILLEYSLPATFMYFVAGMLLALLKLHWDERPPAWLPGVAGAADGWLLAALGIVFLQFHDYGDYVFIGLASFLAIGACVLPLTEGRLLRALGWRPLAALGVASYSLYVWHDPIVIRLGTLGGISHGYVPQLVIATAVSVVVALVSYRLVEAPFLTLRRQWSARSPKSTEVDRDTHRRHREDRQPAG